MRYWNINYLNYYCQPTGQRPPLIYGAIYYLMSINFFQNALVYSRCLIIFGRQFCSFAKPRILVTCYLSYIFINTVNKFLQFCRGSLVESLIYQIRKMYRHRSLIKSPRILAYGDYPLCHVSNLISVPEARARNVSNMRSSSSSYNG